MHGPTVAIVEESSNPNFAVGDHVVSWYGWQEFTVSDGSGLREIDADAAPRWTALGVLGHTGLTAWADHLPGLLNLFLYRFIEIKGFCLT